MVRTTGRPHRHIELASYAWLLKGITGTEAGGVKLHAAGQAYRLSFVLPNGAEYAEARGMAAVGDPAALSIVASKAHDIGAGRAVGRRWRELLSVAAQA